MATEPNTTDLARAEMLWNSADALRGEGERLMAVVCEQLKGACDGAAA